MMNVNKPRLQALADRGPLKVMFVITSMPVGGAETLLVNLIRRLDRAHFLPELCCLKALGPLGEELVDEIPTFSNLIGHKYDVGVLGRLTNLLRKRRIDAVVTVGAGDKMFWGRLAAWRAGVPVILSALHSTGWPDRIGRLNRLLTPLTDAFIGVAAPHGRYLIEREGFPAGKVRIVPNGVDVDRFRRSADRQLVRQSLGLSTHAPLAGIVAALRPEKNHELFLRAADLIRRQVPEAQFLVIGDGPCRPSLEALARELGLANSVHFLGNRADVPSILSALDVFMLTSHVEANPVSILEALACETPVVATNVGSIAESVLEGVTGYVVNPGDRAALAQRVVGILHDADLARRLGATGRQRVVERWSLEQMVRGYERLIQEIYSGKTAHLGNRTGAGPQPRSESEMTAGGL